MISQAVICEEIFDDSSHPSLTEIRDYATKIGIDPDSEPQFLPLAEEGLMKPLPPGWTPCYDDKRKAYYYHNNYTGKTQWEHPLDDIYRGLVVKARTESQSLSLNEATDDATYTREELPSLEEPPLQFPKVKNIKLSPIKIKPKLSEYNKLWKQKSEEKPFKSTNLHFVGSFNDKIKISETPKQELALIGGGSIFLKGSKNDYLTKNELKSILSIHDEKSDKEDDKKNVRFTIGTEENLNKNIKFVSHPILDYTLNENKKKLVKPDPTDFIKPDLNDDFQKLTETDSEDDSLRNESLQLADRLGRKLESISKLHATTDSLQTERIYDIHKTFMKQSEFDLQKYRQDVQKSQKEKIEEILDAEKTKQEEIIKQELGNLKQEMENRLTGTLTAEKLKFEEKISNKKLELEKHFKEEEQKLEEILKENFTIKKQEMESNYNDKLTKIQRELEEKFEKGHDDLVVTHNAILDQLKQNHTFVINELNKDFKSEEDIIRKEHNKQISELKNKTIRESDLEKTKTRDSEAERLYEKLRCEKRLLEDKYRCLKDKYLKLKTEIKLSIEKRNRNKEQYQNTTTTTGSETERTTSCKKEKTPTHSPSSNRKSSRLHSRSPHDIKCKPKLENKIRQIIMHDKDTSLSDRSYKTDDKHKTDSQREYDSSDIEIKPGRSRRKLFTRLKSSSTSRINNKKEQRCSPVENLRKQLQKLEDLEDQFPENQGDTYHLRYPFSDGQKFEGSSELEFFRHRIHLERDSIRRAKESLRKQRTNFKQRQSELKLKHGTTARNTLKQLYQEEKELTDMEVSLHRTRSLLGEKVIRLRHLEQSLQRATTDDQHKQDDATLSDLSSHSASSGISSTEFATGEPQGLKGSQFKESSEIIQSLENLNSEIREIWDVLNKQHQASNVARVLPPLPLLYPDFGWPLLAGPAPVPSSIPTLADRLQNYRQHLALANAQSTMVTHDTQGAATTLVEKTRNLRQWLRQNTVEATTDGNAQQATL